MNIPGAIGLLALAGGLAGMLVMNGCKQQAAKGPAPGQATPEVGVVEMRFEPVTLTMELTGRVTPRMVAEVRPQVGGIIHERLFTEGGEVQAGEILYRIDPASYQAAHSSARAALAKSEANASTLRLKAERYKHLVGTRAVSRQEYDDAAAALKQAEAECEVGKAAVETARINLAYTAIAAPISGRIGRSSVTPGALVTANQAAALATIQQLDPVSVDVTRSSADLLRLKRAIAAGRITTNGANQAKISLVLEDGTPYPHGGTLEFGEVTVAQTTASVTLRARFPNPDHLLLPGMFVRARVQEGVQEQGLLAPQRGITRNPAGRAVALVVGDQDKVESRVLAAERTVGDAWLVTDGLRAGDRLIVEGVQRIRPGMQVRVVPAGSKAAAPGGQPAVAK